MSSASAKYTVELSEMANSNDDMINDVFDSNTEISLPGSTIQVGAPPNRDASAKKGPKLNRKSSTGVFRHREVTKSGKSSSIGSGDPETVESVFKLLSPSRPAHLEVKHGESNIWVKFMKIRHAIFTFLENPRSSTLAYWYGIAVLVAILASIIVFILETLPEVYGRYSLLFTILEVIVVSFFTVEYILRLSSSPNPLKWFYSPMNLVDFFAVFPYYILVAWTLWYSYAYNTPLVALPFDAGDMLRSIRLIRIFRSFRYSRFSSAFLIMQGTFTKSRDALILLLVIASIAVVVFSSFIYVTERGTWNEDDRLWYRVNGEVSPYQSVPMSFYWCVVTLTTVGYGDVVPITMSGKIVAMITMVTGVVLIAMPISVLGTSFAEEFRKLQELQKLSNVWKQHANNIREKESRPNKSTSKWTFLSKVVTQQSKEDSDPGTRSRMDSLNVVVRKPSARGSLKRGNTGLGVNLASTRRKSVSTDSELFIECLSIQVEYNDMQARFRLRSDCTFDHLLSTSCKFWKLQESETLLVNERCQIYVGDSTLDSEVTEEQPTFKLVKRSEALYRDVHKFMALEESASKIQSRNDK